MPELLDLSIAGNPAIDWLKALLWVVLSVGAMKILKPKLVSRARKWAGRTENSWDDAVVHAMAVTRWSLIALIALSLASNELILKPVVERWIHGAAMAAFFVQIGLWVGSFLDSWIRSARQRGLEVDPSATSALSMMSFLARVALWSVLLLLLLSNFGFDVTTLIAGLGIGGIAIGLALQSILGDLFASLSIVLDKPFQVGDFIIVDQLTGTVENIGLKTTRVRSLSGEMLVFSNADLTKTRLRNFKQMQERRAVFKFGVTYATTPAQLEAIPGMVRKIAAGLPNVRFDRCHFVAFGDSSLEFEVVYWMLTSDYTAYMDAQQAINLALLRRLTEEGVDFAFPTRTLILETPRAVSVSLNTTA
ncbi:MAG: mechanosensitive ion channel family protein [Burkholderiaceae bacterium]|nr:mechanosensitive ion channel family protein [Burkholderiaceae bacterium]